MKTLKKTMMVAAILAAFTTIAFANTKGNEIMQKAADFKKPHFSMSQVIMTLEDKNGTKEDRQIVEYGKEVDGKTYVVMDFKGPANVKDTRFLQITNENGPDDKFIYLPSLKSVRRVNSSEGSKAFMGSDATYDESFLTQARVQKLSWVRMRHTMILRHAMFRWMSMSICVTRRLLLRAARNMTVTL